MDKRSHSTTPPEPSKLREQPALPKRPRRLGELNQALDVALVPSLRQALTRPDQRLVDLFQALVQFSALRLRRLLGQRVRRQERREAFEPFVGQPNVTVLAAILNGVEPACRDEGMELEVKVEPGGEDDARRDDILDVGVLGQVAEPQDDNQKRY